ncbi:MAG: ABC transporter permease [Prevotella sp.]|nr:ABC transporter permease [Prevotella sp.]
MSLSLFLAKRIYHADSDNQQVSKPVVRIATIGVAIGLAVMIVTVSVVLGFKHTIRNKVVGFGSHIQITNFLNYQNSIPAPIAFSDSLLYRLQHTKNVSHVAHYAQTQGILKTDSDFLGVVFKGVGEDYNLSFLRECLQEGTLPKFSSQKSSYQLVISRTMADKLQLGVGDKVYAYFITDDDVRARRFTVCAIYQSNMKQFDDALCITDLRTAAKLNGWADDQYSGLELQVADIGQLDETARAVNNEVKPLTDSYGEQYTSQTIFEAYPQVFTWLSLLDINVWIILALMVAVAGFTMISGLLIIILERTQMIGLLKALGARNKTVRRTFLWFSVFIIGTGLIAGNIIGIGLVLLQQYTGFVRLDPASYYVSTAPVELNIPLVIALNVATLIITVFVLIAPSYFVAKIHPARAIRFE